MVKHRLPFQHMLFNQNFYLIFMNKICSKKGPGESWYAKKLIFLKSPYKFRFIQIFLTNFTLNVAGIFPDLCYFPILLFQSKVFRSSNTQGYPLPFPIVKFFSEELFQFILMFQSTQDYFLLQKK